MVPGFNPDLPANKAHPPAFVMTSPNVSVMPPPIFHHEYKIELRADGRFSYADPTAYPVWYHPTYQHRAAIPIPPHLRKRPYEFNDDWSYLIESSLYEKAPYVKLALEDCQEPLYKVGKAYHGYMQHVVRRLETITGSLERRGAFVVEKKFTGTISRSASYGRDLLQVAKSMLARAETPITLPDQDLVIAIFQRACLECRAYAEYWNQYSDSVEHPERFTTALPVNSDRMGGYVIGTGVESEYWYRMGYPTRILRPSWDLPQDMQVMSVTSFLPWPLHIFPESSRPPHKIRWMGPLYNSTPAARETCPVELAAGTFLWAGEGYFNIRHLFTQLPIRAGLVSGNVERGPGSGKLAPRCVFFSYHIPEGHAYHVS
jgi:hypothetical protein